MYKDLEFIGEFFLPLAKERINGRVSFNEHSLPVLEVQGDFTGAPKEVEIISFIDSSGSEFTFYKCFRYSMSMGESMWEAQYSIGGHHFNSVNELRFSTLKISVEKLSEWVGITGFKNGKRTSFKKHIIEYVSPKSIKFKIDKTVEGRFAFSYRKNTYPVHKLGITESIDIKIESIKVKKFLKESPKDKVPIDDEVPFLDLMQYAFRLVNFLTIAYYQPCKITGISVQTHQDLTLSAVGINPSNLIVSFEYDVATHFKKLYTPLFSYNDLKPKINKVIPKWFLKLGELEPVFNILLESYIKTNGTVENNFLNVTQAIETLHRRRRKNTKIQPKQFEKLLSEVKSILPEKHFEFFKDKFNYSNEPSLRTRLKELLAEFDLLHINSLIPRRTKFINHILNSRNYYTHYGTDLEEKRLKGIELFYLTEKLKVLLLTCVLFEIGFTKEEISKFFKQNESKIFHLYKVLI